ncbi:MAG: cysteine desulfurase [Candidatus Atribacteria bacterium]|jgi:cysteine desulfurase|nr:MAG: cysteine desulfurase [Candidatus Atribacteria bacterium]
MNNKIYLDNSATTPLASEVLEAMTPFFQSSYGNASSLHSTGRDAHKAMEQSRSLIAEHLGVTPHEIVFTSGATEADNLALLGTALRTNGGGHMITSRIEHDAVRHTARWLATRGFDVTLLDVDEAGRVSAQDVRKALRPDTLLVSVMAGNNEIGTLQPIQEIGEICRERDVLFHTDAVQAYGKVGLPMDVIDMLAVSAHKLHGPKGVGFLYVRKGVKLAPLLHGGGHEGGRRSGTENIPGIVGLGEATRLAFAEKEQVSARMRQFRDQLITGVLKLPGTRLNGHPTDSLPHIANFSFEAIEGESLIMKLDEHDIAASTGSACSSPNLEPSHVLVALGVPLSMAHGSLRISTGRQTTSHEIEKLLQVLPVVVQELRDISPFKVGG